MRGSQFSQISEKTRKTLKPNLRTRTNTDSELNYMETVPSLQQTSPQHLMRTDSSFNLLLDTKGSSGPALFSEWMMVGAQPSDLKCFQTVVNRLQEQTAAEVLLLSCSSSSSAAYRVSQTFRRVA